MHSYHSIYYAFTADVYVHLIGCISSANFLAKHRAQGSKTKSLNTATHLQKKSLYFSRNVLEQSHVAPDELFPVDKHSAELLISQQPGLCERIVEHLQSNKQRF